MMQVSAPRPQLSAGDLVVARIREHGSKRKVEELCLDEIPLLSLSFPISSLIQKCKSLEYLSICGCQLSNLEAMPTLPNLQILELSDNQLQSESIEALTKYSKLYELALDSNRISDYNWARFLKRSRITAIALSSNPIAADEDYREKVYKALGADLEVLDGMDRAGNEVSESESEESESQNSEDDEYSDMKIQEEREANSESVSLQDRRAEVKQGESPVKQPKIEEGKEDARNEEE